MHSPDLLRVARAAIASMTSESFDESVMKLRMLFPETLVLAAFDLVDRGSVIKYSTPWGSNHYDVLGSSASYAVHPSLDISPNVGSYCTCPAFAYSVLLADSQIMCKHVLATLVAEQLSKCVERGMNHDIIAAVVARQYE